MESTTNTGSVVMPMCNSTPGMPLSSMCPRNSSVEHQYDIAAGPMADDKIWDYVSGVISREAFQALACFKHPTHQIVFCMPEALNSIRYQNHYNISK